MKLVYSIFVEVEFDTDTNQSRVLRQFTVPKGKGAKAPKPEPKTLQINTIRVEEV